MRANESWGAPLESSGALFGASLGARAPGGLSGYPSRCGYFPLSACRAGGKASRMRQGIVWLVLPGTESEASQSLEKNPAQGKEQTMKEALIALGALATLAFLVALKPIFAAFGAFAR